MANITGEIMSTPSLMGVENINNITTSVENILDESIQLTSDDIFTQNISPTSLSDLVEMTNYFTSTDILFTSSSHLGESNDINSVDYTGLQFDEGDYYSTPLLKDYVSMTSEQSSVISSGHMDYQSSVVRSFTSTSYPTTSPSSMILTQTPPSASQIHSDINPSVSNVISETLSSTIGLPSSPPQYGSTSPSAGIFTSPAPDSSTQDSTNFIANSTALYIAIPVCFLIILIAVGLSCMAYNKRKKKRRWDSTNERRNLWLNPVSDVSIPINSVSSAVTPDTENKLTSTLLSKTPSLNRKDSKCGINIYRVLYEFDAQLDSQISLKPNDIVSVVEKADNGWYRGEVLGKAGWFPSSYVEEIEPPSVNTLEKVEEGDSLKKKATVTSFLLKKRDKQRKRSRNKDIEEAEALEAEKDGTVSEFINMGDIGGVSIDLDDLNQASGKLYKTVFQYKVSCKGEIGLNVGDMVICYDRDRNGWMRGKNLTTNEEGWFPAVYVSEASENERPPTPTPLTYDQLASNRSRNSNTDAIGIEHKALYNYNSGKSEDLTFEAGDTIVVFETLENGWWLGCKGDEVGWLPGSYVELLDKSDDNSSNASSSVKNFSIFDELEQMSVKSNRSSTHLLDDQLEPLKEKDQEKSTKIIKRESLSVLSPDFKPARKAPLPPSSRPQSASPRVTVTTPNLQKSMESLSDSISEKIKQGEKPELPIRFVKPKLVKVPKASSKKLRNHAINSQPKERPLPPRPPPPKSSNQSRYKKYKRKDQNNPSNNVNNDNGEKLGPISSTPVERRKSNPPRPPIRNLEIESADDLNVSTTSIDSSLNNSVGPKILNRISAHLLDEVADHSGSPKMGIKHKKLKKVSPPVLPPPPPPENHKKTNEEEKEKAEERKGEFMNEDENSQNVDAKEHFNDDCFTDIQNDFVSEDMHIDMGKYLAMDNDGNTSVTDSQVDSHSENVSDLNGTIHGGEKSENKQISGEDSVDNSVNKPLSEQEKNQSQLMNELNNMVKNNTDSSDQKNSENTLKLSIPETNGIKDNNNVSKSPDDQNQVRKSGKPKVAPKPLSPKPLSPKPIPLKSPPPKTFHQNITIDDNDPLSTTKRTNLRIAIRSFRALEKGELSFDAGSFIMDIDEECSRPGWCVGMLADGTTGIYPLTHVGSSRSELQTEL